jgi:hypothetical protein
VYTEDKLEKPKTKKWKKSQPGLKKPVEEQGGQTFDLFILIVIFINTFILVLKWPNMSPNFQQFVDVTNEICTGVFIVEAVLKLIAFGKNYFKDSWNVFDFVIVVGSLIFISPTFKRQKKTVTMIRAFRIGRAFKLFK